MAGLLGDVLPYIYQRANALKRGIGDFVADPMGSIAQGVNYANDRAGGLLAATRAATDESIASGGLMYGPANQKLAGILANAYNPMGITVYHGSPHKFAKFDSSKIGTGEGAQAYGHGLYLAESPDVAGAYRKNLSQDTFLAPSGKTINRQTLADMGFGRGDIDVMLGAVQRHGGDFTAAADAMATHRPTAAKFLRGIGIRGSVNEGSLYKVDLPDSAVARMLDWDKPLSQQAPIVQEAMKHKPPVYSGAEYTADELLNAIMTGMELPSRQQLVQPEKISPLSQALGAFLEKTVSTKPPTGEKVYRALADQYGHDKAAAMMREAGIPGIRYLDGGSRGLGGGTSNFVIFPGEESLLTILERNGMPLPK